MNGSKRLITAINGWTTAQPEANCLAETGSAEQLLYKELPGAVQSVRAFLGDEPLTIVMSLPSGVACSVVWLAALSGGHKLVPVSPQLTDFELQAALDKHQPDMMIVSDDFNGPTHPKIVKLSVIKSLLKDTKKNVSQPGKEGSVFLSTSGSTGKPKGIVLSATQCVLTAQNIIASHELTDSDICLCPLPFYHVNAPVVSLLSTILSGGQLVIAARYRTEEFWSWVETYRPTWISLVPTMIAMLLTTDKPSVLNEYQPRFVRTASAQLPEANLKSFETTFGLPVIETYGLSEAGSTIVANPVPPGKHIPGSVGLPIGIELRICQPATNNQLPMAEVGEVVIRGGNVITAYEGDTEQSSFVDDWFHTGDLGYVNSESYVFLTGRIKDIIVRGGENILPRDIEEIMYTFPGVSEAVVVGQADALYGEKVVAYVTANNQPASDFSEQLRSYLLQRLSRYKVPADIHVLDELPRTHAGKIDKPRLRQGLGSN